MIYLNLIIKEIDELKQIMPKIYNNIKKITFCLHFDLLYDTNNKSTKVDKRVSCLEMYENFSKESVERVCEWLKCCKKQLNSINNDTKKIVFSRKQ